jgi:hypothetical protein
MRERATEAERELAREKGRAAVDRLVDYTLYAVFLALLAYLLFVITAIG